MIRTDGSNERQFTYSSGDEWDPRISPNGNCVAFLSDRLDAKNKTGTRIWVMPLNGGEAKPLTDPNFEIIDFKWNADGSHIYYLAYAQKAKRTRDWVEKRQKAGFDALDRTAEKPRAEVWSVDKSECKHQRLFVGDPGVSSFDINPSGELLVYSTNYTGDDNDWVETDLFLFSIHDSSDSRQLTTFKGSENTPLFSPDGQTIAFERPQEPRKPFSQTEIETISLFGTKIHRLTENLDLSVSSFEWYTDRTLLLEVNQGMNNHPKILQQIQDNLRDIPSKQQAGTE